MIKERDRYLLEALTTCGRNIFPANTKMWLYGSRARGEANEESDWDILILMDKDKVSTGDFDEFAYPLVELGWANDAVVSPQIYTNKEWDNLGCTPYYKNITKEKIEML